MKALTTQKSARSATYYNICIILFTALAYGVWPSAMRAVYADGANAAFVIVFAGMIRCTPMLFICLAQKKPLFRTKPDIRNALTGGFFQAISSSMAFAAVMFLPGPLVVVIMFTHTLMLLLYMIARGEAKADAGTLATTVSALIGLIFVLDLFHKQSSHNLLGMGVAFLSAIAIASRLYVYGHQMKTRHPAIVGAENFLVAIFFTLPFVLYQTPVPPHSIAGYGWFALGSVTLAMGTLGQFYGISALGSFRFSLFMKLEPMFATIFAALLIGDILQPLQYFGIVMVTGSLALYQLFDHRRRRKLDQLPATMND